MREMKNMREIIINVIEKIIEEKIVIGEVGDVEGIGREEIIIVEKVIDEEESKEEEIIEKENGLGIEGGEVVVEGKEMKEIELKRVEIERKSRNKSIELKGENLGDEELMKKNEEDEMKVERENKEKEIGRLERGGERVRKKGIERFEIRKRRKELGGIGMKMIVGKIIVVIIERSNML